MKTFRLRIVSPDQVVYDGDVEFVQFMGMDGSYGILANHAPLMTATRPGPLRVRTADGETTMESPKRIQVDHLHVATLRTALRVAFGRDRECEAGHVRQPLFR